MATNRVGAAQGHYCRHLSVLFSSGADRRVFLPLGIRACVPVSPHVRRRVATVSDVIAGSPSAEPSRRFPSAALARTSAHPPPCWFLAGTVVLRPSSPWSGS